METEFKKRQVERSFERFRNLTSYVFQSDCITFPSFFKNLMSFCETDEVMKVITSQLKQIDITFEDWSKKLLNYQNGRTIFYLPDDETQRTALIYKICLKIYMNEIDPFNFCLQFDSSGNLNDLVRFFNTNFLTPLVDSIGYKIEDISDTINDEYQGKTMIPLGILNVYDNSVKIGNGNVFADDTVVGSGGILAKKEEK
jgi:hypothetical protein